MAGSIAHPAEKKPIYLDSSAKRMSTTSVRSMAAPLSHKDMCRPEQGLAVPSKTPLYSFCSTSALSIFQTCAVSAISACFLCCLNVLEKKWPVRQRGVSLSIKWQLWDKQLPCRQQCNAPTSLEWQHTMAAVPWVTPSDLHGCRLCFRPESVPKQQIRCHWQHRNTGQIITCMFRNWVRPGVRGKLVGHRPLKSSKPAEATSKIRNFDKICGHELISNNRRWQISCGFHQCLYGKNSLQLLTPTSEENLWASLLTKACIFSSERAEFSVPEENPSVGIIIHFMELGVSFSLSGALVAQGQVTCITFLYQAHLFPCRTEEKNWPPVGGERAESMLLLLCSDMTIQEEQWQGKANTGWLGCYGAYIHVSEAAAKNKCGKQKSGRWSRKRARVKMLRAKE